MSFQPPIPQGRISDRDDQASKLQNIALENKEDSYLSIHTLINNRAAVSTRYIYRHLLSLRQRDKTAAFILPVPRSWADGEAMIEDLGKTIDLRESYNIFTDMLSDDERWYVRPLREIEARQSNEFKAETLLVRRKNKEPVPDTIKRSLEDKIAKVIFRFWCTRLQAGMIIQNHSLDSKRGIGNLKHIHQLLVEKHLRMSVPLIVMVDLPGALTSSQEREILWFLRDASQLNAVVWLHTPLTGVSESLLSHFGHFVIFHASLTELALIKKALPVPSNLKFSDVSQNVLMYTPSKGLDKYQLFPLKADSLK